MTSNSDGCWTKMLSNLKGLTSISSFACDSLADSLTKDLKKWRARTNADFPELFGPKIAATRNTSGAALFPVGAENRRSRLEAAPATREIVCRSANERKLATLNSTSIIRPFLGRGPFLQENLQKWQSQYRSEQRTPGTMSCLPQPTCRPPPAQPQLQWMRNGVRADNDDNGLGLV